MYQTYQEALLAVRADWNNLWRVKKEWICEELIMVGVRQNMAALRYMTSLDQLTSKVLRASYHTDGGLEQYILDILDAPLSAAEREKIAEDIFSCIPQGLAGAALLEYYKINSDLQPNPVVIKYLPPMLLTKQMLKDAVDGGYFLEVFRYFPTTFLTADIVDNALHLFLWKMHSYAKFIHCLQDALTLPHLPSWKKLFISTMEKHIDEKAFNTLRHYSHRDLIDLSSLFVLSIIIIPGFAAELSPDQFQQIFDEIKGSAEKQLRYLSSYWKRLDFQHPLLLLRDAFEGEAYNHIPAFIKELHGLVCDQKEKQGALIAVHKNWEAIKTLPKYLITTDVMVAAIKQCPLALNYFPDPQYFLRNQLPYELLTRDFLLNLINADNIMMVWDIVPEHVFEEGDLEHLIKVSGHTNCPHSSVFWQKVIRIQAQLFAEDEDLFTVDGKGPWVLKTMLTMPNFVKQLTEIDIWCSAEEREKLNAYKRAILFHDLFTSAVVREALFLRLIDEYPGLDIQQRLSGLYQATAVKTLFLHFVHFQYEYKEALSLVKSDWRKLSCVQAKLLSQEMVYAAVRQSLAALKLLPPRCINLELIVFACKSHRKELHFDRKTRRVLSKSHIKLSSFELVDSLCHLNAQTAVFALTYLPKTIFSVVLLYRVVKYPHVPWPLIIEASNGDDVSYPLLTAIF